jgi:hypothetical protein
MKSNSQLNTILNDKIEKKINLKKNESTKLTYQTRNPSHETVTT